MFRSGHVTQSEAHDAKCVPGARIPRSATQSLLESRASERVFAPTGSALASRTGTLGVPGRNLGSSIVERKRLVVTVSELERVTELDPRRGTRRTQLLRQTLRFGSRTPEVALEAMYANQQASCADVVRMLLEMRFELLARLVVAPLVGEHHRMCDDIPLARTSERHESAEQQQKGPAPEREPSRNGAAHGSMVS